MILRHEVAFLYFIFTQLGQGKYSSVCSSIMLHLLLIVGSTFLRKIVLVV
ncbi:hypothetical protein AtNW77_Chr1g0041051 [Arabidopsis thaliana]